MVRGGLLDDDMEHLKGSFSGYAIVCEVEMLLLESEIAEWRRMEKGGMRMGRDLFERPLSCGRDAGQWKDEMVRGWRKVVGGRRAYSLKFQVEEDEI